MGPTWVLSAPDGPHVGPMNLVIWEPIIDLPHGRHAAHGNNRQRSNSTTSWTRRRRGRRMRVRSYNTLDELCACITPIKTEIIIFNITLNRRCCALRSKTTLLSHLIWHSWHIDKHPVTLELRWCGGEYSTPTEDYNTRPTMNAEKPSAI